MEKVTHSFIQGSPEWLAFRASQFNASEASAMLGISQYQTRSELLRMKATGISPDISAGTQRIFDEGHRLEALARPIAEKIIGEDLFSPTVSAVVEGLPLSASFDGVTLFEDYIWEHKTLNKLLAESLSSGEIPEQYKPQLEQQLLIMGSEKCLFMASNGTEESALHAWYESDPQLRSRVIEGWKQFKEDLAAYMPVEAVAEAVGKTPETLPALRIEVTGMVTASNLEQFKAHSLAVISAINTDLQTDQHFADAETTVKWCSEVEGSLAAAKQHALSQTESIDVLFRTIEDISEEVRRKRLELNKLVTARKVAIRDEIVIGAAKSLQDHLDKINATFGGKVRMPAIKADFAGAIRGKKTISSLRDAADSELARAKIEASQIGDGIRANLESLRGLAKDHTFLFNDAQQLVLKDNEDLVSIIRVRIGDHEAAEAKRIEAQREQIRQQELQRIANEQAAAAKTAEAKPEPVAAPAAETPKPAAVRQVSSSPKVAPKPTKLEARVNDLEALVKAVAAGEAPISVLTINWEALDAIVDAKGSAFSMPGITLEQVAA